MQLGLQLTGRLAEAREATATRPTLHTIAAAEETAAGGGSQQQSPSPQRQEAQPPGGSGVLETAARVSAATLRRIAWLCRVGEYALGLRERLSRPAVRPFRRVRDASGCSDGRLDAGGTRLRHVL